jgi:hypothetical protein
MFRVVIVVAVAALPVIVVGLLAEPIYAAILLGLELIAGLVVLWRGLRGPRSPSTAPEGERSARS